MFLFAVVWNAKQAVVLGVEILFKNQASLPVQPITKRPNIVGMTKTQTTRKSSVITI